MARKKLTHQARRKLVARVDASVPVLQDKIESKFGSFQYNYYWEPAMQFFSDYFATEDYDQEGADESDYANYAEERLLELLQQRLTSLLDQTVHEVVVSTLSRFKAVSSKEASALVRQAIASETREIKRRMRAPGRGGARPRKNVFLETNDELKKFATLVQEAQPLWKYICGFLKYEGYESQSIAAMKFTAKFERLSKSVRPVPDKVLRLALGGRIGFERGLKIPRQYQPLALAMKHACLKLNASCEYSHDTLKKRLSKGKKLLESMSVPN
jgi:hypothetical protein